MLGYTPPVYLPSTGGYNSQSGTRKSYRQALALGELQTFLVQGVWSQNQLFPQEVAKGVLQWQRSLATQLSHILALPAQLEAGKCPFELQSRPAHPFFPVLHPKTYIPCSRGSQSIITQPAEPEVGRGRHRRPRGKAHAQSTRHHSFFRAASSLLGQSSHPPRENLGPKSPHPRGRAAFEARRSGRCSPSGSCGCRTCRRTPCRRRRGCGST